MTDFTRSTTLSVRRPNAALTSSRPRQPSAPTAGPAPSAKSTGSETTSADRAVRSETLLQGQTHVSIVHNGETYQLRATRLGKLILTK